jgi:hypothetical protein
MSKDALTEDQATERLVHHLLRESYRDLASVLLSANDKAAESLFYAIEKRTADALKRIVTDQSEGAASTRIALAVGSELNELFDAAHGRAEIPKSRRVA